MAATPPPWFAQPRDPRNKVGQESRALDGPHNRCYVHAREVDHPLVVHVNCFHQLSHEDTIGREVNGHFTVNEHSFYNNCQNSRTLIGSRLLSIRVQTMKNIGTHSVHELF